MHFGPPAVGAQTISHTGRWNVSLFHCQNHGAAYGRVPCGFEVSPGERAELGATLTELGFGCGDETENAAARFFLR